MGSKPLIELMSIAGENEVLLGPDYPTNVGDFKTVEQSVKASMLKQRFQDASKFGAYFQYSKKASVLLHGYMLRVPIPASLTKDLHFLLQHAHKFLSTLLELSVARQFIRTVFGIFDLMQ